MTGRRLRFLEARKEPGGLKAYAFEKDAKAALAAGDRVEVTLPQAMAEPEYAKRVLHVASAPGEQRLLLAVAPPDAEFERRLDDLDEGATILAGEGIDGIDLVKEDTTSRHIVLALGAGAAVGRGLVLDAAATAPDLLVVYAQKAYGGVHPFAEDVREAVRVCPGYAYELLDAGVDEAWVRDAVDASDSEAAVRRARFYVIGERAEAREAQGVLEACGASPQRIRLGILD